jgi:hypothetical protein
MNHYSYHRSLHALWTDAVEKYQRGNRHPASYFGAKELRALASVGLGVMDVYDYAEDFAGRGEPDFATFLMICEARRDYFLNIQKGVPSEERLDPETLPAKTDAVRGIEWLPRIIPKARAKLRGELPAEIMYGCGGDRKFLRENNIHPAEFLRAVWAWDDEEDRIIDWVEARRAGGSMETPA